jgi:magnesium and cobalt transporter
MSDDKSPTQKILRRIRKFTAPKDRAQLRELLRNAGHAGLLDADALSMVEGVLDVSDLQVRDIMVLEPDGDKIVGILLAKDLLRLFTLNNSASFDIRDWMRKALFVPESKRVNVLLKELRMGRNHMAIAVDEYGSVAGLVTIEDVIEQIIGEIDDEFDVEVEKNIRREGVRQFAVQGATRIDEFNEYFGAQFPDTEFDTIAGLVTQHFGRLPRRGEAAAIDGFEFRVIRADRRRIETLRVTAQAGDGGGTADSVAAADDSG